MSIAVESEMGQTLGATTEHIPCGSVREEQQRGWPISDSTHTGGASLAPSLRCSSVTDPWRICSLVSPRLGAKSISAATFIVFQLPASPPFSWSRPAKPFPRAVDRSAAEIRSATTVPAPAMLAAICVPRAPLDRFGLHGCISCRRPLVVSCE